VRSVVAPVAARNAVKSPTDAVRQATISLAQLLHPHGGGEDRDVPTHNAVDQRGVFALEDGNRGFDVVHIRADGRSGEVQGRELSAEVTPSARSCQSALILIVAPSGASATPACAAAWS
jgi:hypothetical protein